MKPICMSENEDKYISDTLYFKNPYPLRSLSTRSSSILSELSLASTIPSIDKIITTFRESVDSHTCEISALNDLESAINKGIDLENFQLLKCELKKIFLAHDWPASWFSRILANSLFLSAYFSDLNLAILSSNCLKNFVLLENFDVNSEVILNSITNSLTIVGTTWNESVYNEIIDFLLTFLHRGTDTLWQSIPAIVYKISPTVQMSVISSISADNPGLYYYFCGPMIYRSTLFIIAFIKGILDSKVKNTISSQIKSIDGNIKEQFDEVLDSVIPFLPKSHEFFNNICKLSESPENIFLIHLVNKLIDSKKLATQYLELIGMRYIYCYRSLYHKWQNQLQQLDIDDAKRELLEATGYQPHVWASLILDDPGKLLSDEVVEQLKYIYSDKSENKYFTIQGPSCVLYKMIKDIPQDIIKQLLQSPDELKHNIVFAIRQFIMLDKSLANEFTLTALHKFSKHNEYKVKLEVAATLQSFINLESNYDLVDTTIIELIKDKKRYTVILDAVDCLDVILSNRKDSVKLDVIRNFSLLYFDVSNQRVSNCILKVLSKFFFNHLILYYGKYNVFEVIEILLKHMKGKKSLKLYYKGLDFSNNPVSLMYKNNKKNIKIDTVLDFWFHYLEYNIKSVEQNKSELIYVLHIFSVAFPHYYQDKIEDLVTLLTSVSYDNQSFFLLLDVVCNNMNNSVDEGLKERLVKFLNCSDATSPILIQYRMKTNILCDVDVTDKVKNALDILFLLSEKDEFEAVEECVRDSILELGTALEYPIKLPNQYKNMENLLAALVKVGMSSVGSDSNFLNIILSCIYSCIANFDNIKYLNIQNLVLLMQKSVDFDSRLSTSLLLAQHRFFLSKFEKEYNKHADELASSFAWWLGHNLTLFLYKCELTTQHLYLLLLQGLVKHKMLWVKTLAPHVFACYFLNKENRDLCIEMLKGNTTESTIAECLEEGVELLVSSRLDFGKFGEKTYEIAKPVKKLYKESRLKEKDRVNLVRLFKNKLDAALTEQDFKTNLGVPRKIIFIEFLISFIMIVCEKKGYECELYLNEVKKLVFREREYKKLKRENHPFRSYVYNRIYFLSKHLSDVQKGKTEKSEESANTDDENEKLRISLYKKCLKIKGKN